MTTARLATDGPGNPIPQQPAFLTGTNGSGGHLLHRLEPRRPVTIGRATTCDVALEWDASVSRTHAVLEPLGASWTLDDGGISRNGTFVNGARVGRRRRLLDGDVIRVGRTDLRFRDPASAREAETFADEHPRGRALTPMQRTVLVALCRPLLDDPYAPPATNAAIAAALVLSTDAVKTHLRGVFERFDVRDQPQNRKRALVATLAIRHGLVTEADR